MRVVVWNVRKASTHSPAWDYLLDLQPDVALIQDARLVPDKVRAVYEVATDQTAFHPRGVGQHLSAILAKGRIGPFQPLPVPTYWLRDAVAEWREYFTTRRIELESGEVLNAMSVYSLAVPVPRHHWQNQDTEGIQLPENRDIWATELMWSILSLIPTIITEPWIAGGDLNSSVSFDVPKPRGNQRILDRMQEIGMPNIARWEGFAERPTFRHSRGGFRQQLDYLFANQLVSQHLDRIDLGDPTTIFAPRPMLSDHLPIIADFRI